MECLSFGGLRAVFDGVTVQIKELLVFLRLIQYNVYTYTARPIFASAGHAITSRTDAVIISGKPVWTILL
jgi:hypothetical protein